MKSTNGDSGRDATIGLYEQHGELLVVQNRGDDGVIGCHLGEDIPVRLLTEHTIQHGITYGLIEKEAVMPPTVPFGDRLSTNDGVVGIPLSEKSYQSSLYQQYTPTDWVAIADRFVEVTDADKWDAIIMAVSEAYDEFEAIGGSQSAVLAERLGLPARIVQERFSELLMSTQEKYRRQFNAEL